MARPINPDDPGGGGGGEPGDPGYVPPTSPGTKLAAVVTSTSLTFTADQIAAAGGPWPAFTLRVTAINDKGSGPAVEVDYP
jgi:hypothetical protein